MGILPYVQEVSGLSLKTSYCDRYSMLPSILPGKCEDSTSNQVKPLPFKSFTIHDSPIFLSFNVI
jgi:hypothetical protein